MILINVDKLLNLKIRRPISFGFIYDGNTRFNHIARTDKLAVCREVLKRRQPATCAIRINHNKNSQVNFNVIITLQMAKNFIEKYG